MLLTKEGTPSRAMVEELISELKLDGQGQNILIRTLRKHLVISYQRISLSKFHLERASDKESLGKHAKMKALSKLMDNLERSGQIKLTVYPELDEEIHEAQIISIGN